MKHQIPLYSRPSVFKTNGDGKNKILDDTIQRLAQNKSVDNRLIKIPEKSLEGTNFARFSIELSNNFDIDMQC